MEDLVALADEIETTCSAPLLRVAHDVTENTDRVEVNGILEAA